MVRSAASRAAVLLVLLTSLVAAGPTPSAAAAVLPATFSADALSTWQTNGSVWALETIGNVVYAGGSFTSVRPPGAAAGTGEVPRNNFAAFDATTGDLLPCDPSFTHTTVTPRIWALEASPAGDRLYVGGVFSRVGGTTTVANLAAIDPATCTIVPTTTFRRPVVNATVRALSATSTNLYVGGDFGTVDGQARTRFAAFSSTGSLTPAAVTMDGGGVSFKVNALLAAPDAGRVYLGGDFANVGGVATRGLVAVNPQSGAVVQTFPGWIPANSAVKALTRDATGLYVGAEGTGFGVFDGRIAADISTGTMRWKDYCLGATQALVVDGGVLYAGHHAHECSTTPGGWEEDGFRTHLTGQDVTTKELIPTFFPETNDGVGSAPLGPRALVVSNGRLWAGGEFTTVNDSPQRSLTRFAMADIGSVSAPVLTGTSSRPGENVISWLQSFDRDDDLLTYELYRNDVLIHTVSAPSRDWARTTMSYVDTGLTPGSIAKYRIRVLQPGGINPGTKGATLSVTNATSVVGYRGEVLTDRPSIYWRLDETAQQTAGTRTGAQYQRARMWDSSGNGRQATAERGYASTGGYALGAASALADGTGTGISFDGTVGRVAEGYANSFTPAKTAPSQYSVELWFRTTGSAGGRLIGFGNRRTENYERVQPGDLPPVYKNSTSTTTDRVLYLNDTGQLIFGNQAATKVVARSAGAYNDGLWHHTVATSGPGGMKLYVDGVLRATNANTQNATYAGYWKVGYDSLTGWPEKPANPALTGAVDEVAVYPTELSGDRVAAHFRAGQPTATVDTTAPTAPSGVQAVRSSSSVQLTWAASTDNVGVTGYEVHRTSTATGPLSASTRVGTPTSTAFSEDNVPPGTWYYRVVALDAAGNASAPSAAVAVTIPSAATTITVTSSADTYVNSASAATNYGTATNFLVDSSPQQIGYLRFQLPAAPAGTRLVSAVLRLRTTTATFAGSVDPQPVQLASSTWTETTMNWSNKAALVAGSLGSFAAGSSPGTTYDAVLDPARLAPGLGSLSTLALPGGGADSVQYQTREFATGKPQLVLGFAP